MFHATRLPGYVRLLQNRRLDVGELLAGTGLHPQHAADPDAMITLDQYQRLAANMVRLTGDPGIALAMSEVSDLRDLGILGYALVSSRSMRQALGVWMQYSRSLLGMPLRLEADEDADGSWSLTIVSFARPTPIQRFSVEEFLVIGVKLFRALSRQPPEIRKISFSYPEPSYGRRYREIFGCPIEFGADRIRFVVSTPGLDTPIDFSDEKLDPLGWFECTQQLVQPTRSRSFVTARLHSLFIDRPGDLPTLENAARMLGMSSRSLRRQLDSEGLSYQQLKDEFRLDLARRYLRPGHLTPKEVAYLLGYAGPSAFCRAFKSWTGLTVQQYFSNQAPAPPGKRQRPATARWEPLELRQ